MTLNAPQLITAAKMLYAVWCLPTPRRPRHSCRPS